MKKSSISIQIEDEKLKALRLFAGRKGADVDAELEDALQKMYEKYVPKDARDYIELALGEALAAAKPKPARAAVAKQDAKKPEPHPAPAPATGNAGSGVPG